MSAQATSMVLASFVADSLALGVHWIYDTASIDQRIGFVDSLRAPLPDSYHAGKKSGQFTHYGDQALVLLESLARTPAFLLSDFAAAWQNLFINYTGYIDKATSTTLDNLRRKSSLEQCGSTSSDLGGAARIAPLVFRYQHDKKNLLTAVKQQTALTHNNPGVLAGVQYIADSAWNVLHGQDPVTALTQVLDQGFADMHLSTRIRAALDTKNKDTRAVIKDFGQVCDIGAALPGAVHLIVKYPHDLKTALIENVMAGGDSAARGLVVGMILGASLGEEALPLAWLAALEKTEYIKNLLQEVATRL